MIPDLTKLPPGWLTEDEALLLFDYVSKCEGDILEVGCFKGRSTILLAQTGRQIWSVDPFKDFAKADPSGKSILADFTRNTAHLKNVSCFVGKIEDWKVRPVGFAYLDGDHTYDGTLSQIRVAKLCNPSIIAAHDVNDKGGGLQVKRACLEKLGAWEKRVGRLAVFNNVH